MGISLIGSDLLYIVTMANRNGLMAVIEDQKVAIFTPVMTEVEGGFRHVGFHIDQVQTVGEAQAVLRSAHAHREDLQQATASVLTETP